MTEPFNRDAYLDMLTATGAPIADAALLLLHTEYDPYAPRPLLVNRRHAVLAREVGMVEGRDFEVYPDLSEVSP